jgi:hypothetical protein
MWKWQITHPDILGQPHTQRYNDQRRSNFSMEMDWVTLNREVGRHTHHSSLAKGKAEGLEEEENIERLEQLRDLYLFNAHLLPKT